ncbi:lysozyme [Candidatus Dojkabacteria bacterium]|jgi:GH24 family phage-related lysozyme (muramidase)|nr:lysozyme [Candidatus Dojkabacteria bacterium]
MIKTFENYNSEFLLVEKLELQPLFDQLKKSVNKKIIATIIVGSLLSILNPAQAMNYIENNSDLSSKDKIELVNVIPTYKYPKNLKLSQKGWDFIRDNEKFIEVARKLGDGMITVGYGHAEPIKTSKYKVGYKMSKTEAHRLFLEDVNIAARGVKRIFKEWENIGIKIKITQNQYDVIVDLAYNMGISNLRQTKFVQALKKYDLQKAANLIRETGLEEDFPGLEERRKKEFIKFITN